MLSDLAFLASSPGASFGEKRSTSGEPLRPSVFVAVLFRAEHDIMSESSDVLGMMLNPCFQHGCCVAPRGPASMS